MKLKLFSTTHSKLDQVPVVGGQIVCSSDVNGFYYDMGATRNKLQPADDILYCLIPQKDVTASGYTGTVDYSVTSGTLNGVTDLTATPYESLEFVFYDRGSGTQFAARLHGLPYGSNGLYTYNWCGSTTASLDLDTTQTLGGTNIYRETLYANVAVTADGTFRITSKTRISETVEGHQLSITETDASSENRVALLKVVGRR